MWRETIWFVNIAILKWFPSIKVIRKDNFFWREIIWFANVALFEMLLNKKRSDIRGNYFWRKTIRLVSIVIYKKVGKKKGVRYRR